MNSIWTADYSGNPFELFGAPHVFVLAVVGLAGLALIAGGARIPESRRRPFRVSLAALLVVNEALWHMWAFTENLYTLQEMLPLHLCSVMVWLSAYALLATDRRMYGVMYFLGTTGALQALITPDAGVYGFPHVRFLQTMISHALVFLAGIYVASVEGYRPTARSVWRIFIGLNVYALIVGLINAAIGSNYLYVSGRPDTPSIIDLMPPWPWYLLYLEVIALGLLALLYLPFVRRSRTAEGAARDVGSPVERVTTVGATTD